MDLLVMAGGNVLKHIKKAQLMTRTSGAYDRNGVVVKKQELGELASGSLGA
jgi:hypothetical protein